MPKYNYLCVIGHLGGDWTTKNVGAKSTFCAENTVSVTSGFGDREASCFMRFTLWGKRGEIASQKLGKGDPILVSGELRYRQWQAADGKQRTAFDIDAKDFAFVGGGGKKKKNDDDGDGAMGPEFFNDPPAVSPDDDGIPF